MRTLLIATLFTLSMAGYAAEGAAMEVKPYPLSICLVSGKSLEGVEAVSYVHEGQEFKFAGAEAIEVFKADPAKYVAMLAEKVAAAKAQP